MKPIELFYLLSSAKSRDEFIKILRENINDLHIVSKFLFENETMTCDQLEDLIRKEAAN